MLIFIPFTLRTQALLSLDSKSVGQIIQSYAQKNQLNSGKELHSLLIRSRHPLCTSITNHLINMYSKCGLIAYAQNLFDKMPVRNLVSWTSMITAFSQNSRHPQALIAFSSMRASSETPTQFAFASAARASASLGTVWVGKQLHGLTLKFGLGSDTFVGASLSCMYSKCGDIADSLSFFEEMPIKDAVLWTSMIDGFSKNADFESALEAFRRMMREDGAFQIDPHILSSALSACASMTMMINTHEFGKCLQSIAVKLGFGSEMVISDTLVNMYLRYGDVDSASKVLEHSTAPLTYTIRRLCETGRVREALDAFVQMRRQGVEPKESTFASLIKACCCGARDSLEQGVQVHAQVVKLGLDSYPYVCSCLVNMYGKCGLLDRSTRVLDGIRDPGEMAWDSFVKVFGTFDDLVLLLKPNAVTSTNLLMLCGSVGLVNKGLSYFGSMEKRFGVGPTVEHYNCVVCLLSRAGMLREAEEFMRNMPFEANALGLSSYLEACGVRGDAESVKFAAESLVKIEPDNTKALVMLSNVYAKEQRWKELRSLKKRLRNI